MREGGGLVTREDLRAYRVVERRPLSIQYRGLRVVTNPRPSLGGPLVALALTLQEAANLSRSDWGSEGHVKTLAVVLREVDRIRAGGRPFPLPGEAGHVEASEVIRTSTGGTTHMNVSDAEGNVASFSASNGEGCGVYVPDTGIMLNNMMGEDDLHPEGLHQGEPGSRISSMMSPSMLVDEGGVVAALGTGGSKRIRTALHQTITNLVDFDLPVEAAVNLPRLHLSEGTLHVEPGYPDEALDVLRAYGKVQVWEAQNVFFGGVHTVRPRTGEGAGDGRRAGHFMRVE
jgi:gamma-glutamyltranspeptidase/glutathione hydrolase